MGSLCDGFTCGIPLIFRQILYSINKSWAISIEYTDDPHPRNAYWEMWGLPLFDIKDPGAILYEVKMCKKIKHNYYIKMVCFDNSRGVESAVLSFIVHRPGYEPGFRLVRQEMAGRNISYTMVPYSVYAKPPGERYIFI